MEMEVMENKFFNVGLLVVATLLVAKIISALIMPRSNKRLPLVIKAWPPLIGGLLRFPKGPIIVLREEYPKLSNNITFLIGPEVSTHLFKVSESDLSRQEVYRFNVPNFGPGVVFDEQFCFFTKALRVNKLKGYVDQMVVEAQASCLLGREVRDKLFDDVSALFHEHDNGMQPISVMFPYLPIPAHCHRDRARKRLIEIFASIIASRKAFGKCEDDMLQCFIDSKYKNSRPPSEGEVTGPLIAALFAGQHTTYLLRFKEYFVAVVEEQKTLMKKHGEKIDHDILSEMESHTDFSVTTHEGKEYDIPKGHIVVTSLAFANRLSHIYKNPDSYDPNRFAPRRDEDTVAGPFLYIFFGGSRHRCLGEPFVYLQIKAIWSHLLRNFELELISPFLETDWNAMVVGVKGKVMARYKRRRLSANGL
ncbi:hypothetical protein Cgig2_006551 [Carnegiea gigantea]|uniref:Cytochrome P450 n=1 Tax=Carnegiea gigantea TaxID=171969 RepID=A0A9Q1JVM0_9CARY|nr:hypothetical protein Cgig2_006551 [Carnegiea gigantea]